MQLIPMLMVNSILLFVNSMFHMVYIPAANKPKSSVSAMDESRTRVHSHYMRELTLGKFIVKISEITLLETIGEGIACLKELL